MSDKVLLVASVASMIQQFNMRNIDILLQMGYQVEVACNFAEGNTCAPEQIGELKKELEKIYVQDEEFKRLILPEMYLNLDKMQERTGS